MASSTDDRTLPVLTHILAFFFSWIAPLIILLVSDKELVKRHARRALNWQLSLIVYTIGLIIVMVVSVPLMAVIIGILTFGIAIAALIAVSLADIVFCIIAAVKASNDEVYTYPITIPFVRDPETPAKTTPPKTTSPKTSPSKAAASTTTQSKAKPVEKIPARKGTTKKPKA